MKHQPGVLRDASEVPSDYARPAEIVGGTSYQGVRDYQYVMDGVRGGHIRTIRVIKSGNKFGSVYVHKQDTDDYLATLREKANPQPELPLDAAKVEEKVIATNDIAIIQRLLVSLNNKVDKLMANQNRGY